MRMWQIGIGVIVLAAAMTATVAGRSGQPADTKEGAPFGDKLIVISTANSQNTLKNVQVRKLGDRSFVVGTSVRESTLTQEEYPGRTLWIPVADVQEIVEFDDLVQLRRTGNGRQ